MSHLILRVPPVYRSTHVCMYCDISWFSDIVPKMWRAGGHCKLQMSVFQFSSQNLCTDRVLNVTSPCQSNWPSVGVLWLSGGMHTWQVRDRRFNCQLGWICCWCCAPGQSPYPTCAPSWPRSKSGYIVGLRRLMCVISHVHQNLWLPRLS